MANNQAAANGGQLRPLLNFNNRQLQRFITDTVQDTLRSQQPTVAINPTLVSVILCTCRGAAYAHLHGDQFPAGGLGCTKGSGLVSGAEYDAYPQEGVYRCGNYSSYWCMSTTRQGPKLTAKDKKSHANSIANTAAEIKKQFSALLHGTHDAELYFVTLWKTRQHSEYYIFHVWYTLVGSYSETLTEAVQNEFLEKEVQLDINGGDNYLGVDDTWNLLRKHFRDNKTDSERELRQALIDLTQMQFSLDAGAHKLTHHFHAVMRRCALIDFLEAVNQDREVNFPDLDRIFGHLIASFPRKLRVETEMSNIQHKSYSTVEKIQCLFSHVKREVSYQSHGGGPAAKKPRLTAVQQGNREHDEQHGAELDLNIMRGTRSSHQKSPGSCFYCGQHGHWMVSCPRRPTSRCQNCQEEGHIMTNCPKAGGNAQQTQRITQLQEQQLQLQQQQLQQLQQLQQQQHEFQQQQQQTRRQPFLPRVPPLRRCPECQTVHHPDRPCNMACNRCGMRTHSTERCDRCMIDNCRRRACTPSKRRDRGNGRFCDDEEHKRKREEKWGKLWGPYTVENM
jgi:hypothetical protein